MKVFRFAGFGTARIRLNVGRHALAFNEVAQARSLNCGCVDEHVFAPAVGRYEAEAFVDIKKLYGSMVI